MPYNNLDVLSQGLSDSLQFPQKVEFNPFLKPTRLPNNSGFVMAYSDNFGDGNAMFFNLFPGAMLIKFDGKFHNLEVANKLRAKDFLDTRIFSLRISERGIMDIHRGQLSGHVTPATAVLSCYDGQHSDNEDIIRSQIHTFNHFLFTEDGLKRIADETGSILPFPLSNWLEQKDISTEIHAFIVSDNLRNLVRSLNLQSLSYPNNRDYIQLKYRELFLILKNNLSRKNLTKDAPVNVAKSKVQSARYMIEEAENFTLTTTQAAQLMGMTRAAFNQSFQAEYKESFAAFVRRKKFEKAITLLEQKYSLSEIVSRCGFTEISNFSRAFKSYFGISPAAFRRGI